jgi:hypothetical protein
MSSGTKQVFPIKRPTPAPLRTFGDLEKHLKSLKGPLFSDMPALKRIKTRKKRANKPRST